MKICTIAGAAAEIHAADLGSVVIDKSYHDLVDAVQKESNNDENYWL